MPYSTPHMDPKYMEPTTSTAAGFALFKTVGTSAALGMLGSAMLYMALPPLNKDGTFNKREFVMRLAFAGIFSIFFGEIFGAWLHSMLDFIDPVKHKAAIDLMVGAPGWWVSRALALWFHRNRRIDIGDLVKKVRSLKE